MYIEYFINLRTGELKAVHTQNEKRKLSIEWKQIYYDMWCAIHKSIENSKI